MISVPFFFTPAQDASTEATERPASARTADEVRAGRSAGLSLGFGANPKVPPAPRTPRDLGDIFFDAIKATVGAFDGR